MLTIRLQRVGKAKQPTYRLIVSEKARDTQGNYLELLGSFDPRRKENQLVPNIERIKYWLSKGASASGTVHNLLIATGIISEPKKRSVFLSTKRKAKLAAKKPVAAPAEASPPAAA